MKLSKILRIHEVRSSDLQNAPFQLIMHDEKTILTLDQNTCNSFGITMTHHLVHRELVCSCWSREKNLRSGRDSLIIKSFTRTETNIPHYGPRPSILKREQFWLHLATQIDGVICEIPCPFYDLFFELTEKEYLKCKALPAGTIFRLHLALI